VAAARASRSLPCLPPAAPVETSRGRRQGACVLRPVGRSGPKGGRRRAGERRRQGRGDGRAGEASRDRRQGRGERRRREGAGRASAPRGAGRAPAGGEGRGAWLRGMRSPREGGAGSAGSRGWRRHFRVVGCAGAWRLRLGFLVLYSSEKKAGRGELNGPLTGLLFLTGPCCATRRAGVAAHARHAPPGRASTGMVATGPCRVWAGPKKWAFGRAFVLRAAWTSMLAHHLCIDWPSIRYNGQITMLGLRIRSNFLLPSTF